MRREEFKGLDALFNTLMDWADWCRSYRQKHGYPSNSAGFGSETNIHSFDDLCERVDNVVMVSVDTAISDLPPAQNAAINRRYLQTTFRFPRDNYEQCLDEAHNNLLIVLPKKGVVIA